jgi:hypothetical protein
MHRTAPRRRQAIAMLASLAACAAAWLAAAPPAVAAKAAPEAIALDAGFRPAEQAGKLLKVTDPASLKGLRRVAIPQFTVEFITSDNVSAETSSFGAAGRTSVTGFYRLVGVAEPDFQALAEGAYAAFVRDLQASGIEVVPAEQVAAAPSYRKLASGGTPLPLRADNAITVAPPGQAMYGVNRAQARVDATPGLLGALSGIASVASAISAGSDNIELQKELGDAVLLEVALRVHFAQLSDNNRGFFGRMASNASVTAKVHAAVTSAKLSVYAGQRLGLVSLDNPLMLDASAFTELRKQEKTGSETAGAVAVGLLRLAIGGGGSHSSDRFEAVADGARYREVVGGGLTTVGQLFVERIKADR